jgi:hypothetical protein
MEGRGYRAIRISVDVTGPVAVSMAGPSEVGRAESRLGQMLIGAASPEDILYRKQHAGSGNGPVYAGEPQKSVRRKRMRRKKRFLYRYAGPAIDAGPAVRDLSA